MTMVVLTVAAIGMFCTFACSGRCRRLGCPARPRPAAIALINSIGNLAGFGGPYLIGWVKEATGSTSTGCWCCRCCRSPPGFWCSSAGTRRRSSLPEPGQRRAEPGAPAWSRRRLLLRKCRLAAAGRRLRISSQRLRCQSRGIDQHQDRCGDRRGLGVPPEKHEETPRQGRPWKVKHAAIWRDHFKLSNRPRPGAGNPFRQHLETSSPVLRSSRGRFPARP